MKNTFKLALAAVLAGTYFLSIQQASAWWGGNRWNDDDWYDRSYRYGRHGWGGPYGGWGGPYGGWGSPYGYSWGGYPGYGYPYGVAPATSGQDTPPPPPRPE